jgi:hypothetical protein
MRFDLADEISGELAGLAQLVERWSHNPKVVSSILTPGSFAWMNSEGSGLGLQIQGGLTSQWFESTFCAYGIIFLDLHAAKVLWPKPFSKRLEVSQETSAPCGARTHDLWLIRPILYQLS